MIRRGLYIPVVFLMIATSARGGVGTWKNYTSMKDVAGLARGGSTYWAATSGGLFSWQEGTSLFQTFTNAEGLQSINLSAVAVDVYGNVWAGTTSGVISVYSPATGTFRTILDIANDRSHTDRNINSFAMSGDTVLICTNFGMSVFRISPFQFADTYVLFGTIPANTTIAVFGAAIVNGRIWASMSDGQTNNFVVSADLNSPNLTQPDAWSVQAVGPRTTVPKNLAVFRGNLYAGTSAGLYRLGGGTWNPLGLPSGRSIVALSTSANALYACTSINEVFSVDSLDTVRQFQTPLPFVGTSLSASTSGQPVAGCLTGGVLSFESGWVSHFPNGPNSNQFSDVAVDADGVVWCASGFQFGTGMYRFDGTTWTSFTTANSALPANEVYRVSVSCNGSLWGSTWGGGAVEVPHGSATIDAAQVFGTNVGIEGVPANVNFIVVTNVVCDSRGTNWMSSLDAADHDILIARLSDGTWLKMPVIEAGNRLRLFQVNPNLVGKSLAVDAYDNLWAVVRDPLYKGMISLWNSGSIDSTVAVHVGAADGLPSDQVNTIIVDADNNIWVGTDKGIGIIVDPLHPTAVGGIAAYKPLNGLAINTIAVDPLNQKWVGTTQGVVLLSSDGTQELASYTVESTAGKLISDNITSIAVDAKSGTVYFASSGGLASLSTVAAAPKPAFDALVVYPNPYRVPNTVPLTVDGLMENSTIKILSIDGHLIREIKSPGGRVGFWDGKDTDGHDVASGIYLVVAASEDGSKVVTGKVAVLKH